MLLESAMRGVDHDIAFFEGWGLFESSSRGIEIEKDDEAPGFANDGEARCFVRQQARQGSLTHIRALAYHQRQKRIRRHPWPRMEG